MITHFPTHIGLSKLTGGIRRIHIFQNMELIVRDTNGMLFISPEKHEMIF